MKKKEKTLPGALSIAISPSFANKQSTQAAGIPSVQTHGGRPVAFEKKSLLMFVLLLLTNVAMASGYGLQHVKNTHSIGLRAGTGWGQTYDLGISYNYQFHHRWAVQACVDYERGSFKPYGGYQGFRFAPGAEAMVWQPCRFMYLHLGSHFIWGWDWWTNRLSEGKEGDNGTLVGCDLGFNLEFYAMPELSFTLGAEQQFRYSWLNAEKYAYFTPLFSVGVKYNIR